MWGSGASGYQACKFHQTLITSLHGNYQPEVVEQSIPLPHAFVQDSALLTLLLFSLTPSLFPHLSFCLLKAERSNHYVVWMKCSWLPLMYRRLAWKPLVLFRCVIINAALEWLSWDERRGRNAVDSTTTEVDDWRRIKRPKREAKEQCYNAQFTYLLSVVLLNWTHPATPWLHL